MTQTKIDIDHAEAPELICALAEQLCPGCGSNPPESRGKEFVDGPGIVIDCLDCKGTGLANPWASELCHWQKRREPPHLYLGDCACNGSGRVSKAVGLEDVLPALRNSHEHPLSITFKTIPDEYKEITGSTQNVFCSLSCAVCLKDFGRPTQGDTDLLAALRAAVRSLKDL